MAQLPCSPLDEIDGLIYFPRLCDKIRLHASGDLHEDYIGNLGIGMDQWTCEFLNVNYTDLSKVVQDGASDAQALEWARENGAPRPECDLAWWTHYMKTRGFRDDMSDRLTMRKAENGWSDRDDIQTFMDYIVADEK